MYVSRWVLRGATPRGSPATVDGAVAVDVHYEGGALHLHVHDEATYTFTVRNAPV